MSDVLERALKLVEPQKKDVDYVDRVAEKAFALVKDTASKFDVVEVIYGGSYAKGTWLKEDVDIDIFVKIRPDLDELQFERIGKELGMKALRKYKPYLRYSEHPYVEAFVDKISVNVVPCYDVEKGKWKSAADRSPYHTEFVRGSFDDEKKRQARLLKRFMKTIGVYGAEIATSGFSGYVCEVLVSKYGSCMGVLQAAAEFREKQVIGIESIDDSIAKFFESPLIIIDPVDSRRNLGTAISDESVGRLILAARRFIESPDLKFFKPLALRRELRFADNLVLIEFSYRPRSPDIIWGQLKSSARAIGRQLSVNGFKVMRYTTATDENGKAIIAFMLESTELPSMIVRAGPKAFNRNDSKKFVEKNRKRSEMMWVGDDLRLFALLDSKYVDVISFLKHLLSKNIESSGISNGLMSDIRKSFKIYYGKKVKNLKEEFASQALTELVTTDMFAFG
jgi:tRNA nucleotidyltransferase (CCA-adding enzyme)